MACLNLNQVILAGRITADPELRHSPTSGKMCCSFCIAYNHRKSDKTMVAEYFRVTVWDKTAETVCRYSLSFSGGIVPSSIPSTKPAMVVIGVRSS